MKKPDLITLIIKGTELSYKKEIDKTTAGKILAICLASDGKLEPNGNSGQVLEIDKPSGESLVEFLNRHAPKRNPDKILTLAGYLKQERGRSSFTFEEVKRLFRDAGEIFPGNFSRDSKK
jgi:hypothetical protein